MGAACVAGGSGGQSVLAQADELDAETTLPAAADRRPGAEPRAPEVLGNLRGDVSVDALADLDLLILRGNERDIEAVMAVIDKIEEMAIGATPGIALHFLNNVDSEALAALLNDVYTRLTTLSTGTAASARQSRAVNVVAVGSPNAVLMLAPQNTLDSVLDLAEQLDQPQPPGTEVEVFFLRNAVATQVVTLLEGFYEERPGLGTQHPRRLPMRGRNSVVVNASPKELQEVTKLVREIDNKQSRATAQVRVVPLKNCAGGRTDGVPELRDPGGRQSRHRRATGQQPLPAAAAAERTRRFATPSPMVLEFLTSDGAAQKIVRSGVLSDIRISGDVRSNTLTVTAPEASMPLILELVAVLDQPTSAVRGHQGLYADSRGRRNGGRTADVPVPGNRGGAAGSAVGRRRRLRQCADSTSRVGRHADEHRRRGRQPGSAADGRGHPVPHRPGRDSRNRRIEVLRLRNSPVEDVAHGDQPVPAVAARTAADRSRRASAPARSSSRK